MQTDNNDIWNKDRIQHLIRTNDRALARALWVIFQRQTADEKATNTTRVHNARGFNSRDAGFLSDVAKALPRYDFHMTPRQVAKVRPMMLKYWRQLLEEAQAKGRAVDTKVAKSSPKSDISPPRQIATAPAPAEWAW